MSSTYLKAFPGPPRAMHACSTPQHQEGWSSDGIDLTLEFLQVLLDLGVLRGHLLVLGLPLISLLFESLNLSLEVAGLNIGLSEPVVKETNLSACRVDTKIDIHQGKLDKARWVSGWHTSR